MKNAILTGSRVYGNPTEDSDVDLVVFMDPSDAADLARHMGAGLARTGTALYPGLVFRAGKLNVMVESDPEAFDVWVTGTSDLVKRRPVTRDEAVEHFKKLRAAAGAKA